jgi:hypothetical protein
MEAHRTVVDSKPRRNNFDCHLIKIFRNRAKSSL